MTTPREKAVLDDFEVTEAEAAEIFAIEPADRTPFEQCLVAALVLAWEPKQ